MFGAINDAHGQGANLDNSALAWCSDISEIIVQAGVLTNRCRVQWWFAATVLPNYLPYFLPQPIISDGSHQCVNAAPYAVGRLVRGFGHG